MAQFARVIRTLAPWVVCAWYAATLLEYYPRYLDLHLRYAPPDLASASEDILGFGFLATWIPFLLLFGLSYWFAHGRVRRVILIAAVLLFAAFSAVDLCLSQHLESQVMAFKWK